MSLIFNALYLRLERYAGALQQKHTGVVLADVWQPDQYPGFEVFAIIVTHYIAH